MKVYCLVYAHTLVTHCILANLIELELDAVPEKETRIELDGAHIYKAYYKDKKEAEQEYKRTLDWRRKWHFERCPFCESEVDMLIDYASNCPICGEVLKVNDNV